MSMLATFPTLMRTVLPFPAYSAKPGEVFEVTCRPQRSFQVSRLVIASTCAFDYLIECEKLGLMGVVPAAIFSEIAIGINLNVALNVTSWVTLKVTCKPADLRERQWQARKPVYINRRQAWHKKYKGAWWVTRTRWPEPHFAAALLGVVMP